VTAPVAGAAWPIPAGAVSQWRALTAALRDVEPPCADDPELWCSYDADEREAACHRCQPCPALAACGRYADAAQESLGVWAGVDRARMHPVQPRGQTPRGGGDPIDSEKRNDRPSAHLVSRGPETNRPMRRRS